MGCFPRTRRCLRARQGLHPRPWCTGSKGVHLASRDEAAQGLRGRVSQRTSSSLPASSSLSSGLLCLANRPGSLGSEAGLLGRRHGQPWAVCALGLPAWGPRPLAPFPSTAGGALLGVPLRSALLPFRLLSGMTWPGASSLTHYFGRFCACSSATFFPVLRVSFPPCAMVYSLVLLKSLLKSHLLRKSVPGNPL